MEPIREPVDPTAIGRILLALEPGGVNPASLELAFRLARQGSGELRALLLEDSDLLAAAALPISRELARNGSTERGLDSKRLARSLRAEAERLKRLVTQEAENARVRLSFATLRGPRVTVSLAELRPDDLLIMSRCRHRPWHQASPATHAVALLRETADGPRLQSVVAAVSGPAALHCEALPWGEPQRLVASLRLRRPGVVVLSLSGDSHADLLHILLERLECPLLIVP